MPSTPHPAPELLHHDFPAKSTREALRKVLLCCGVLYALLYAVANDVIAASLYHGYSRLSQAISELSATGSPAQPFLTALLPIFSGLLIAFGLGVWRSAHDERALRVTGALLLAQGVMSFLWLLAPMSPREEIATSGGSYRDVLHIVLSAASVLVIFAQIGSAAIALGRRFRLYSLVTILVVLASGAATFMLSSRLSAGEPTPWLGLVERISFGSWLLWMAVLALVLLRDRAAGLRPR